MPLKIKIITIKELKHQFDDKEINLSPDWQRREVWGSIKKMLLVDSVARGVPISALTFYEDKTEDGTKYDVIDGKQRLSALFEYFGDRIIPDKEKINDASEEEKGEEKEKSDAIIGKKWSELKKIIKDEFFSYELPVYFVSGPPDAPIKSFRRMNEQPFALRPQEIRNAVYKNSHVLKTIRHLLSTLEKELKIEKDIFLLWGVIKQNDYIRMADVQFCSELLNLKINGVQHRRETLDSFYLEYLNASPIKRKKIDKQAKELKRCLSVVYRIFGDSLDPYFKGENKAYSLVGAFLAEDLYKAADAADDVSKKQIKEIFEQFGDEIILHEERLKDAPDDDEREDEKVCAEVANFTRTLLKGQLNSKTRREIRINILVKMLKEIIRPPDPKKPTEAQRRYVWAKSKDKMCARCGLKVEKYSDYDCGHINAKAHGGRCVVSNLRVEHIKCNRSNNQHRIKPEK